MRFEIALAALAVLGAAGGAMAEPTPVTVRVLAKDAKFIGDSMGGVAVTLTDARSGAKLAEGVTKGGTGDTGKIMGQPRARGAAIAGPEAAAFSATLDLSAPTLVRLEARGPLGKPGAAVSVSQSQWLLPGKGLGADGWVVEMPGLVVEPAWTASGPGAGALKTKVTLMCGCPITPGGMWDAGRYEIQARLSGPDGRERTAPLAYAGEASTFAAAFEGLPKGRHRLLVTAHNADTGNAGVAEAEVVVP